MRALAVLLLVQFVPLTSLQPATVHGSVERFKDLSPPTCEFDGPIRAAMIVFEPGGFKVMVMQRNGARLGPFHFTALGEKCRLEVENK